MGQEIEKTENDHLVEWSRLEITSQNDNGITIGSFEPISHRSKGTEDEKYLENVKASSDKYLRRGSMDEIQMKYIRNFFDKKQDKSRLIDALLDASIGSM